VWQGVWGVSTRVDQGLQGSQVTFSVASHPVPFDSFS
jgi:hypothetical protein